MDLVFTDDSNILRTSTVFTGDFCQWTLCSLRILTTNTVFTEDFYQWTLYSLWTSIKGIVFTENFSLCQMDLVFTEDSHNEHRVY